MKFIALVAAASALQIAEPWDKASLPDCPKDDSRTLMDDRKTHVTKYPYVGASCKMQIASEGVTLIMLGDEDEMKPLKGKPLKKVADAPPAGLEHCPDFDERHTLVNGRVRGIAWPAKGFNCQNEGHH